MQHQERYLEGLESQVGWFHPQLVQLIRRCLHNVPETWPPREEVLDVVQRVMEDVEGVYGGIVVKMLDVGKVLLTKELKIKEALYMVRW